VEALVVTILLVVELVVAVVVVVQVVQVKQRLAEVAVLLELQITTPKWTLHQGLEHKVEQVLVESTAEQLMEMVVWVLMVMVAEVVVAVQPPNLVLVTQVEEMAVKTTALVQQQQ
jgi:hypothetical protein